MYDVPDVEKEISVNTFYLPLLVSSLLFAPSAVEKTAWKKLKGEHFIIYYTKDTKSADHREKSVKPEKFARNAMRKAEKYYKSIANELGYTRHSKFWTWDNRMKIYIYPDHDSYVKMAQQPKWSNGVANYGNKEIISYRWKNKGEFLNNLLPHELGHIMFRDFIGFEGEVPLWLDEGVAQWQEKSKREIAKLYAKNIGKQGKLLQLKSLMAKDNDALKSEMNDTEIYCFYVQAISVVDFLITTYGNDDFIRFCRQLRDGKSMNEALRFSYPTSIRNIEGLEKKWLEYLSKSEK